MADLFDDMPVGGTEGSQGEESSFSSGPVSLDGSTDTQEPGDLFSSGIDGQEAGGEAEAYTLTVSDYGSLMVSSVPVGALLGAIFMIVGLTVLGIVKIFKKA